MVQNSSQIGILVLAKAVKEKVADKAREAVSPGEYAVDLTLRVQGTLRKGEDYEKEIPNRVKWDLLAAILASKVNDETLVAVIREFDAAEKSGSFKDLGEKVKEKVQATFDEIRGQTRAMVNGPITTDLSVEVLAEKVESSPLK